MNAVGLTGVLGRQRFVFVAALALVVQIWLTSNVRIIPLFAPHDESNYVEHARSIAAGAWFGPYDDLTLIKRPFFPMYLAFLKEFGIPLPIAHSLLYASACLTACAAIRPLIKSQWVLGAVFVALLFNPFEYATIAWTANRSQVNPSLALIVVSCSVALYVRRRLPAAQTIRWSTGLGIALAAFWLTREEALWIMPCVCVMLGAYAFRAWRGPQGAWAPQSQTVVVPLLIWLTSLASIMTANGMRYGWYIIEEQQAPEFVSAYNSLARIDVPELPYIGVSKAARTIAYSVSPAAKELEVGLEGPEEAGWKKYSCRFPEFVCGTDYSRGFFIWAFRDAVSHAGHYSSGGTARAYYLELARELDEACSARRITCRPKALTMAPPIHPSNIPTIARNFFRGARGVLRFDFFEPDAPYYPDPTPFILADYETVVVAVANYSDTRSFTGWLMHERMKRVEIEDEHGVRTTLSFQPSPDVFQTFAASTEIDVRHMNAGLARFNATLPCASHCSIVATTTNNITIRIPLETEHADFRTNQVFLHLDRATVSSPYGGGDGVFKAAVLRIIGRGYQLLLPWIALAGFGLLGIRLALRRSQRIIEEALIVGAVAASCCMLIFILATLTSLSYFAFIPEYASALYPLVIFASTFVLALEFERAYGFARGGNFSGALERRSAM